MFDALTSMEDGTLCQVRAERGAETAVSFIDPILTEVGVMNKINKIKRSIVSYRSKSLQIK